MRHYLVRPPTIRPTILAAVAAALLLGVPVAAQSPTAWEYGILELSQPGAGGNQLVFCRASAKGCEETVFPTQGYGGGRQPFEAERKGSFDPAIARAMARLGAEGWELVGETHVISFNVCDGCRVLNFKRPLARRE